MIGFLVPESGAFGIRRFLEVHGEDLTERIRPITYERVWEGTPLPVGTYVFSALDTLTPAERRAAVELWDALRGAAPEATLLNHPERALGRLSLLDELSEEGSNRFRAVRADGSLEGLRYPVFVRAEDRHTGSFTDLLPDRAAVTRALRRLRWKGYGRDELLVVEFCDSSDDEGLFRKYAAFVVGDRIVPKSLRFSDHWVVKSSYRSWTEDRVEEEHAYLRDNPHADELLDIARRARIGYGRFDYAITEDGLQVWELNTNPTIGPGPVEGGRAPRDRYWHLRQPGKRLFRERFRRAWRELDPEGEAEPPRELDFSVPGARRLRISAERRREALREGRRDWVDRALRLPGVGRLRSLVGR